MLRRALFRALVLLGGAALLAYPVIDLISGRGAQSTWLNNASTPAIFYLAGAYLFWRRPSNTAARRLMLAGVLVTLSATSGQLISVVYVRSGSQPWFWLLAAAQQATQVGFLAALLGVFAVFPGGSYQRRYERWAVRAAVALVVLIPAVQLLALPAVPVNTFFVWGAPAITNPLHLHSLSRLRPVALALTTSQLTLVAIAAGLLIARYRRLDAEGRLRARWPLFSLLFVIPFGMGPVGYLVGLAGVFSLGPHNQAAAEVFLPTLPTAFTIGLLRPHLLDLEVVIRKSVIYAALWMLIALAYIALAAAIGVATAQRYEVAIVVLATILATVVFQPARRALERLAARLVYGERLTGFQVVTRLGAGLEETASPQQAATLLAATVRQALDSRWARVEIDGSKPVRATDGRADSAEPVLAAPIVYGAEIVGRVECGPRAEGRYRSRDEELLATLTRHAGLAIRNAALASELADRLEQINVQAQELQASRARIVQAEEAGRRRLERDIHDGVQQELVALLAKIRLARNQLGRDTAAVERLLQEVQEETKLALNDLRALAQGIHPTVLSDRGLVEAVEDRISRLPGSVELQVTESLRGARFPQAVEGAAYFTVCEALANAMKHAAASRVMVRLEAAKGDLLLDVLDDGVGFDPAGISRSGLSGLQDRIEALGGDLEVSAEPGRGTRLRARLPVPVTVHA